jgi:circadian clock protein KaiB
LNVSSVAGARGGSQAVLTEDSRAADTAHYLLRLYIVGQATSSTMAIAAIKNVCETSLKDRYELEVIDLYLQPSMAQRDQIIVAPTLVRVLPAPVRRFIGDFSATERVITTLGLKPHLSPRTGTTGT